MAVKLAPGETEVKEVRTRVEGVESRTKDPALPTQSEFMDWISVQPKSEWDKRQLSVRIYRGKDTKQFCTKLYEPPFSIEWIQANYGGGDYKILAYENGMIRWNIDVSILGTPKEPTSLPAGSGGGTSSNETTSVLRELVGMLRDELREARGNGTATQSLRDAMSLGTDVLRSAVPAVSEIVRQAGAPPPAAATNPMDEITRQFMTVAIQKMLNPSDPIETFAKMMGAMKTLMPEIGGSAGKTDLGTELIRSIPSAIQSAAAFMGKMAEARNAEFQMIQAQGRTQPQLPARSAAPGAAPRVEVIPPQTAPGGAAAAIPPVATVGPDGQKRDASGRLVPEDYWELLEAKIVTMIDRQDQPITDVANELLIWMDVENSAVTDKLLEAGEAGLLHLFQTRRILMQVPQNPRLTEFIKKFLELGIASRQRSQPEGPPAPPPNAGPDFQAQPTA
jgi:hypothetical protein